MRWRRPSAKEVIALGVEAVLNIGFYVVVLLISALFSWAIDNGYWPRDPEWLPCTTATSAHQPCVMDDGKLLVVSPHGQVYIYPWRGE